MLLRGLLITVIQHYDSDFTKPEGKGQITFFCVTF